MTHARRMATRLAFPLASRLWSARQQDIVYEDGIHLDFARNFHYTKAPGSTPLVAPLTSLFTFTGDANSYYMGPSGLLIPSVVNTPRIEYTAAGSILGLLIEGTRTQQLIAPRDHTNAAWVKTAMTAAKDQVGPDGVANSASSLLATGANASSLQTIVQAAVNSTVSFDIKRLVGTGTIAITQDGVAFTDVTAQINSSTYTRVTLTASQLNPVLGVRLGSNADKIAIDFGQFEAGAFASSRMGAAVTRAAETCVRVFGSEVSTTIGTMLFEADTYSTSDGQPVISIDDSSSNNGIINLLAGTSLAAGGWVRSAGANTVTTLPDTSIALNVMQRCAVAYNGTTDYASCLKGKTVRTAGAGALPVAPTQIRLGSGGSFWNPQYGHIRRMDYWPERKPNDLLQTLTR